MYLKTELQAPFLKHLDLELRKEFINPHQRIFLTRQEIESLHTQYKSTGCALSLHRLVLSQAKMVYQCVVQFINKFSNPHNKLSIDDVVGYAYEHLLYLINHYNPQTGTIQTYIRNFLTPLLQNTLKADGRLVKLPVSEITKITKNNKLRESFVHKHQRDPFMYEEIEDSDGQSYYFERPSMEYETVSGDDDNGAKIFSTLISSARTDSLDNISEILTSLTERESLITDIHLIGGIDKSMLQYHIKPISERELRYYTKKMKNVLEITYKFTTIEGIDVEQKLNKNIYVGKYAPQYVDDKRIPILDGHHAQKTQDFWGDLILINPLKELQLQLPDNVEIISIKKGKVNVKFAIKTSKCNKTVTIKTPLSCGVFSDTRILEQEIAKTREKLKSNPIVKDLKKYW